MINPISHQEACSEVGTHQGPGGVVTAREILTIRQGIRYTVTVAHPSYLKEPPEDGEKVLVLPDITSVETICQELASRPIKELEPFLTPQVAS